MSLYRTGLDGIGGSLLLPDDQLKKIDEMRKDTLDRVDRAAATVKGGLTTSAVVTGVSMGLALWQAHRLARAR